MKTLRTLLALVALLISATSMAQTATQTYILSELNGSAFIVSGKDRLELKKFGQLKETDRIQAGTGTRFTIDCIETKTRYTLTGPCTMSVKQITTAKDVNVGNLTEVYAKYLLAKSLNAGNTRIITEDGVAYRDVEERQDTIVICSKDSVVCEKDSVQ